MNRNFYETIGGSGPTGVDIDIGGRGASCDDEIGGADWIVDWAVIPAVDADEDANNKNKFHIEKI